jgi:hypothetical protein
MTPSGNVCCVAAEKIIVNMKAWHSVVVVPRLQDETLAGPSSYIHFDGIAG